MPVADYFNYETDLARNHLIPLLKRQGALRDSIRILDVGCGYGGVLLAMKEANPSLQVFGIDRDEAMVAEGRKRLGGKAEIFAADFFTWEEGLFDLVLMRDVLEHIRQPEQALQRAVTFLNPGGILFASFAPFFGPFGGHQQNGSGVFSFMPWLHFLPKRIFLSLLRLKGNSYKGAEALQEDMASVLDTRLTLKRFRQAARKSGLEIKMFDQYLSRPDYRLKFGWPSCLLPNLGPVSELFATGVEAILRRP